MFYTKSNRNHTTGVTGVRIELNTAIWLEPLDGIGEAVQTSAEELGDGYIKLSWPSDPELTPHFEVGQMVKAQWEERGGVYWFEASVARFDSHPFPSVYVRRPDRISSIQRRGFYRIPATVPFRCHLLRSYRTDGSRVFLGKPVDGQTQDVSGGGVAVTLPVAFHPGSVVKGAIFLPGNRKVEFKAQVVRCGPKPNAKYQSVGFSFVQISPADQDAIVSFVLAQERTYLQRGLLRG